MTDQEMFDKVATHLLTQKIRAHDGSGCKYRTLEGLRCAAGCLLPDWVDTKAFEGVSLRPLGLEAPEFTSDYLSRERALRKAFFDDAGVSPGQVTLLRALQVVHDGAHPEYWLKELGLLARTFKLSPAVLEGFKVGQVMP
jgi:hypothetical protein